MIPLGKEKLIQPERKCLWGRMLMQRKMQDGRYIWCRI